MYKSLIFFLLDDGDIKILPHEQYADLVRLYQALPSIASKRVRVADWYVELKDGFTAKLVNETYSILVIDPEGRVDWSVTLASGTENADPSAIQIGDTPTIQESNLKTKKPVISWLPNASEREALNRLACGLGVSKQ